MVGKEYMKGMSSPQPSPGSDDDLEDEDGGWKARFLRGANKVVDVLNTMALQVRGRTRSPPVPCSAPLSSRAEPPNVVCRR